MSEYLTVDRAFDLATSVHNLYTEMIDKGFLPAQAWEFTLNFYKGAGKS